ncbi:hypothetical protein TorRG33x02_002380 [Trema orientale]|uniref:Uncharacterized protein n=1 Tax=Trema orientale TaxID=63057 RepID=A0A2P5G1J9_TREOI|nr:hypothetical protein TorRG33x02_002380 [Trema orientale]
MGHLWCPAPQIREEREQLGRYGWTRVEFTGAWVEVAADSRRERERLGDMAGLEREKTDLGLRWEDDEAFIWTLEGEMLNHWVSSPDSTPHEATHFHDDSVLI